MNDETKNETQELKFALMDQWFTNHAEHCGGIPAWPHQGDCYWPMPSILAKEPNVAYLLLRKVLGESVGLRL